MSVTRLCIAMLVCGVTGSLTLAQNQGSTTPAAPATPAQPAAQGNRPPPPARDPRTPGYVTATNATELPDGAVPPSMRMATTSWVRLTRRRRKRPRRTASLAASFTPSP